MSALTLNDYGWNAHFQKSHDALDLGQTYPARVMAVHRDAVDVAGPEFTGRVQQTLIQKDGEDRPTTGDWVAMTRDTNRLAVLYPRQSLFKRRSAGTAVRMQLIAANIDTVFFVTSANQDFNVPRMERYLAMAHEAKVTPVVIITKTDLCADPQPYYEQARAIQNGLLVEMINAKDKDISNRLAAWLGSGQTIAMLGSSGVGKSTIINSLMGAEVQGTQAIREADARGRHTTSGRSLHRMPSGAWLMDTPGMRELQIVDVEEGIEMVFDDIVALAENCKFSNCAHVNEPGCAVLAAVKDGTLEPDRVARFKLLQHEEAKNSGASQDKYRAARQAVTSSKRRKS